MRRLQRLTAALVAGAGALALVFATVAAKAFPGRSTGPVVRHVARRSPPVRAHPAQTAPPLTPVGSAGPQAPSASAPSVPAPTPAPPVVVSGGS